MEQQGWLATVIGHEVQANWADAQEIVARIKEENPNADPDILVNAVIDDKARIAAFVGIGTGALQAIPAVGVALGLGSVLPEALYLAKVQVDIALVIALLYKEGLSPNDVKGVIVTCLVLALGADFVKAELNAAAVRITRRLVERAIEQMGEQQLTRLLARIGMEATKAGILAKIPLVSVPLNAVMNYGQIQAFGWAVKKFMSPSFVMCGSCGEQTGKLNRFCPKCGVSLNEAANLRA